VDVILDLMIHDIDIMLRYVGQDPDWIHAVGMPVITPRVDIANVRFEFPSGCVANLTASRISNKTQRKMRFFQRDALVAVDFVKREVKVFRRTVSGAIRTLPVI
jgi:predicted dehydrogenase